MLLNINHEIPTKRFLIQKTLRKLSTAPWYDIQRGLDIYKRDSIETDS